MGWATTTATVIATPIRPVRRHRCSPSTPHCTHPETFSQRSAPISCEEMQAAGDLHYSAALETRRSAAAPSRCGDPWRLGGRACGGGIVLVWSSISSSSYSSPSSTLAALFRYPMLYEQARELCHDGRPARKHLQTRLHRAKLTLRAFQFQILSPRCWHQCRCI